LRFGFDSRLRAIDLRERFAERSPSQRLLRSFDRVLKVSVGSAAASDCSNHDEPE
jgi:hypothetical protein